MARRTELAHAHDSLDLLRSYRYIHFFRFLVHDAADILVTLAAVGGGQRFSTNSVFELVVVEKWWEDCGAQYDNRHNHRDSESQFHGSSSVIPRPDHARILQRDGRNTFSKYSVIAPMLASCISRVER